MKLISTVTLAATLLSFVAADVSKEELDHRVLIISEQCMLGQGEMTNDVPDAYDADYCYYAGGNSPFDPTTIECDYSSLAIDSVACTSAGGRAVRLSYDKTCSDFSLPMSIMTQIPYYLHTACDAEYAEFLEEDSEEASGDICEYDYTIEDLSAPVPCANRSSKSDCKSSGCLWHWRRSTPCFACEDLSKSNHCNKSSDCTWIQGVCFTV